MLWLYLFFSFFLFLFFSKTVTPLLVSKLQLVDQPDNLRKIHTTPIPLVGGILIVLSLTVIYLLILSTLSPFNVVFVTAITLLVIGVVDDKYDISAKLRLCLQIASALILIYINNTKLSSFGDLLSFGDIQLGVLSVPVTIVAVVGMINAKNLIDGIDGLASGLSLICFVSLAYLLWGNTAEVTFLLILIGALLGFISLNLELLPYKNKMFLGDAGSLLLGFITVFFLVEYSQAGSNKHFNPITAVWITAIPLIDIAVTLLRRVVKGKSPFHPDKTHIHHLLMNNGFSARKTLLILISAQALFAVIGCLLDQYQPVSFGAFILTLLLYILFSVKLNKKSVKA